MKFEDVFSLPGLIHLEDGRSIDHREVMSIDVARSDSEFDLKERVIIRGSGGVVHVFEFHSFEEALAKANEINQKVNVCRAFVRKAFMKIIE